jgi:hypothetical protein
MPKKAVYLMVSLDVEEEGLFGGTYDRRKYTVQNTACLKALDPLCEQGIRPTLFCSYGVLTDARSKRELARLRDRFDAEIGAHLHHWNTPPLCLNGNDAALPDTTRRVSTAKLSTRLLAAKLKSLFDAGYDFQAAALTSFRMGRWDLRREHWALLAQAGVRCDASVRPLHGNGGGRPDHFDAPATPYWIHAGQKKILEAPLTVTPLLPPLPDWISALPATASKKLRASFCKWGALALLPVYHPLSIMRAITALYLARGGQFLSLTWHSSEMMPGGTPHIRDTATVKRLLKKIRAWLQWLRANYTVHSVTANDLLQLKGIHIPSPRGSGDWLPPLQQNHCS